MGKDKKYPFLKKKDGDDAREDKSLRKEEKDDTPFGKKMKKDKPFRKSREERPKSGKKQALPFLKKKDEGGNFNKFIQKKKDKDDHLADSLDERTKRKLKRQIERDELYKEKSGLKGEDNQESYEKVKKEKETPEVKVEGSGILRLNKFVAKTGMCSRRNAAILVKEGVIEVNGQVETNPAYVMQDDDVVTHEGKVLKIKDKVVYYLMNKPKNTITTTDDEKGRRTVMDVLGDRVKEKVYPVGRLDRNTTGLLLFTNDGDLANKLSHPAFKMKKIYHATLDKPIEEKDLRKIQKGLELEDGPAPVNSAEYLEGTDRYGVGVDIHIGRNRIVRRIFEHLGYEVVKLDRVYYAGLTKKDLPKGFVRPLVEQEVIMLKHFTPGK